MAMKRPDVVNYREAFLHRMPENDRLFFKFEGEEMNTIVAPALGSGERPRVLVTHDESCFSSHDGKPRSGWTLTTAPFVPKAKIALLWCLNSFASAMDQ
jgi:hypothetical protein